MAAPTVKVHDEWIVKQKKSIRLARTDLVPRMKKLHFAVSFVLKPPGKKSKPIHGLIKTGTLDKKEKTIACKGPPGPGRYTLCIHLWYPHGKKSHPGTQADVKTHHLQYKVVKAETRRSKRAKA